MFVPRMWFDEVQRIGKLRCTPAGYTLQQIGEIVGFVGLMMLLILPPYIVYRLAMGSFSWSLLWWVPVPFILGITGEVIVGISWSLALQKQFLYDYERRVSTWIEDGVERSFTYADLQALLGQSTDEEESSE